MNPARSLQPTYTIDWQSKNILEKAAQLTAPFKKDRDKIRRLFEFVRDEIPYNFAPEVHHRSDFRASHTLEVGSGFCMQKAALLAALCRANGIPARIGFQDIVDYKIVGPFLEMNGTNEIKHHGMNAVYMDGRWIRLDATLDRGLVDRKNYRLVEFDGRRDAVLPETDRHGKPHFLIRKQGAFYNTTPWFAIGNMLAWIAAKPWDKWRQLVQRKGGSM